MMNPNNIVETNFKIIAKNRTNIELTMLLNCIRSIINHKEKAELTITVDNTEDLLTFDFLVNENEIDPFKSKKTFEII